MTSATATASQSFERSFARAERRACERTLFACAKSLGLSLDDLRAMALPMCGKLSVRALSDSQLRTLTDKLQRYSWAKAEDDNKQTTKAKFVKSDKLYVRKICALVKHLATVDPTFRAVVDSCGKGFEGTREAARCFVKANTTHGGTRDGIPNLEWLTSYTAAPLIEALKDRVARAEAENAKAEQAAMMRDFYPTADTAEGVR